MFFKTVELGFLLIEPRVLNDVRNQWKSCLWAGGARKEALEDKEPTSDIMTGFIYGVGGISDAGEPRAEMWPHHYVAVAHEPHNSDLDGSALCVPLDSLHPQQDKQ